MILGCFGVTIPLFNKDTCVRRYAHSTCQFAGSRGCAPHALNAIEGEIDHSIKSLQTSDHEVNTLQQQVIPFFKMCSSKHCKLTRAGNYSYVELITAQQEFLDAQLSLISSAGNVHRIRAEIERLSGLPLSGQ